MPKDASNPTAITLTTANTPGAVAILQLHGSAVVDVLERLTGRGQWTQRRAVLGDFAGIDEGLAILLNDHAAQLMPHGGPRVVQKLITHLTGELGCVYDAAPDLLELYPEAVSSIEADTLDAIARVASPAAIDLLAKQPARWAGLLKQARHDKDRLQAIADRSRILDRLITPPTVVVVGPANVGKSTLTNALMGKSISIVADLPGTTRDWVGGLVELSVNDDPHQAIAVNWLDTPGLRDSDDAIEQRAIRLARRQIERADVLVAMRDPEQDWPEVQALKRQPDLWVINKVDDAKDPKQDAGSTRDAPLQISAEHGTNLGALQQAVADRLGFLPKRFSSDELWAFSDVLQAWCVSGDAAALTKYLTAARSDSRSQ